MKNCRTCKIEKPNTEYHKYKHSKDGLRYVCKSCRKVNARKYYENNKESILSYSKDYYKNNKEQHKQSVYNWRKDNQDKMRKIYKREHYDKYYNDIEYRLRKVLRARLRCAMNGKRPGSSVKDLGCSINYLKKHIESKFQEGMTWDNYGEWHIDHIKPLSKFNLTDRGEFLMACSYKNLQPLWAVDNIKKYNRLG